MNAVIGDPPALDFLFDLSETALSAGELIEHVKCVMRDGEFPVTEGKIHIALPAQVNSSDLPSKYITKLYGSELLRTALDGAARRHRPLLVLIGTSIIDSAVVRMLLDALATDPLIGSAQPRFADALTDLIYPIPNSADPDEAMPLTPRQVLASLPASVITAELPAACLLLRYEIADAIHVNDHITSLVGALGFGLCQARRCGFRNIVLNRAIVATELPPLLIYPQASQYELDYLLEVYPDAARAALETAALPQRRLEMIMGAAFPSQGQRMPLLVDCRGLSPLFNGTSVCVLGLLDGIAAANREWHITVLCSSEAAEFHDLSWRYPDFALRHGEPDRAYAAALVPNQPWHISHVTNLHRHAFVMVFNILDTIGWDVLYPVDSHVAPTWRMIARHADGLAFISHFSQERFQARFPVSHAVARCVAHLSLRADELTLPACRGMAEGNHILLFGNSYDHKALEPTLHILTESFPLQHIVVVGGQESANPLVRVLRSGDADSAELHTLIATARAIVYPSFYEGFGIPVMEGLAYGRPVIVRRSPLWEEIGGHARLPGRLLPFDDSISLVDVLGRVLEDMPTQEISLGTKISSEEPVTGWKECAARLLELLELCLASACSEKWMDRNEVLEG